MTQLSNLLDYENAKIAQGNGESLEILAQESREENSTMRDLTEKATNDAAAVKVITLITIIFLPTTVVSVCVKHVYTNVANLSLRASSPPNLFERMEQIFCSQTTGGLLLPSHFP